VSARAPESAAAPGVYATLADLARFEYRARGVRFLPRQPIHSLLTGRHASRMRGRGLDFEEIRAYQPGDDIRTIDWKVTARTGEPHTRVFTEERDRPALFVVDQRLSMFFGSRRCFKSVAAAEAAALGVWRVFGARDRVGALVFDDAAIEEIRPHRSRRQVLRILNAIVAKNGALRADSPTKPDPTMLNRVLEQARRLAKHDFVIAVVSDFDGADAQTTEHVRFLASHNDVLAFLIDDPLSKSFPVEKGRLVVTGGELQIAIDAGRSRVRRALLDEAAARVKPILEWTPDLGVPVIPISTSHDVAEQVRELLGAAARPRRS
jgi:uncharacterized protein (DUF58 family)